MSQLPFDGHGHDLNEAGRKQLLEVHAVWRRVERDALAARFVRQAAMEAMRCIGLFE